MKIQCKNCLPKEGIEIPYFSQPIKKMLIEQVIQSRINTVRYIIDEFKFSHRDAKYIVTHINTKYGQCHHCKNDKLDEEYMNCQGCGALNFNWKIEHRV